MSNRFDHQLTVETLSADLHRRRDEIAATIDQPPLDLLVGRSDVVQSIVRHPARRTGVAVAAAALVVAAGGFLVSTVASDPVDIELGSGSPAGGASHGAVVRLMVLAGSTPFDNHTLIDSIEDVIDGAPFRDELASRAAVAPEDIVLSACRSTGSSVIDVELTFPDADGAIRVAEEVSPSINALIQHSQRNLPIEQRIPGPLFQQLTIEPRPGGGSRC